LAKADGDDKPSTKPLRASLLIAIVASYRKSEKVPRWEQEAVASGVAHTLSLLLDEAGWVAGADGTRTKDGAPLLLTFNEALPQPRSREVVTLLQEQLGELGIDVQLLPGDQATQDAARPVPGELQVYHSMVARSDFDVLKSQLSSENRDALLNSYPDGSVGDEELDELLAQI
ncbi:hypothetical protein ECC01_23320, partial [Bacillus tequilensis]|nr:hypothetical protein [Bacillus tequilensis]